MSSTHWRLMGNHNQAGFDIAKSGRIKCIRAKFWCLWDLPITAALILSKLTEKNMWNVSKCLEILSKIKSGLLTYFYITSALPMIFCFCDFDLDLSTYVFHGGQKVLVGRRRIYLEVMASHQGSLVPGQVQVFGVTIGTPRAFDLSRVLLLEL